MNLEAFLKEYNIDFEKWNSTGYNWEELMDIKSDYEKKTKELNVVANSIFELLSDIPKVHSVKKRLKEPEHLIEKIIRKKIIDKRVKININTYTEKIQDLIGIRVLHLLKEDWIEIHNQINEIFDVKEIVANLRKGDDEELIKHYKINGCKIKIKDSGYRSIHYIIKHSQGKRINSFVEIQVRTIFEEAWSEIDHRLRYPYKVDNLELKKMLLMLNRISGIGDELASLINSK